MAESDKTVTKPGLKAEPRRPGRLKGRIHIADDFNEPLPEEILAAFRGDVEEPMVPPSSPPEPEL